MMNTCISKCALIYRYKYKRGTPYICIITDFISFELWLYSPNMCVASCTKLMFKKWAMRSVSTYLSFWNGR